MKNEGQLTIKGWLNIRLFDKDGNLKDERLRVPNSVVDAGKALAVDLLQASGPAKPDYIGIGTGATAVTAGDTALGTEVGTRVQATGGNYTQPTATTDRAVSLFAAGNGTGNITEAARFNASSTGTMMARSVFTAVNKTSTDSLQITYDITVS